MSVLHCHGNCRRRVSLSVPPRDLNGKPLKITTAHAFDRRGEEGEEHRRGADSCGMAVVTPQKVDCLWREGVSAQRLHTF